VGCDIVSFGKRFPTFETSGTTYQKTRRHITENLNPQQYRCENLKPRNVKVIYNISLYIIRIHDIIILFKTTEEWLERFFERKSYSLWNTIGSYLMLSVALQRLQCR